MKKILLFWLLFIIVFISCKKSSTPPVVKPPVIVKTYNFDTLTTIMQSNLARLGGNAGLVLLDKTGKILYKQYFGTYSDTTYIPIASASKLLSAATIMTLVDQKILSLEDITSKYYPIEFAAADRKNMTLRQLFSHTSGFESLETNNLWLDVNTVTLQQAVQGIGQGGKISGIPIAAATVPYGPNGSQFAYGGTSMQVGGGMAELAAGKTWDVIFKNNIGSKCKMPNTNYTGLGATTNYRIAGGVGTRMMEYANFLLMLVNQGKFNGVQVVSAASVAEIEKDQTSGVPLTYTPYAGDPLRQNFRYGLGCWIEEYNSAGQISAVGDQGVYGFSPWVDMGRGVVGVLFVNINDQAVNELPTPYTAPYTLIRNSIAAILDK